ncbi:hypothetical protein K457DRAFT_33878 [Linnemannia elongata AG-77]|uniref:Uncharacterized protein n=1 Tax=Linnemannia elongata AG-77 TaxID=1314771 RepID=A0A197JT00_9FUNG|nr:hypothetical protein K457DRAFT_33878 [Linnemannia elongata AG-77]
MTRRPSSVVPDTVFLKSRVEFVFSASVSDCAPLDPIQLQAKCNFIRVKLAMTGLAASLYPWVASVREELAGLKMQSDIVGKFRQALRRELKERQRLQQEFDDLISPGNISTQHPQPVRTSNDPGQEEDSPIHRFLKRQRIALGEAASEDTYPSEEIEHYFNRPMAQSSAFPGRALNPCRQQERGIGVYPPGSHAPTPRFHVSGLHGSIRDSCERMVSSRVAVKTTNIKK